MSGLGMPPFGKSFLIRSQIRQREQEAAEEEATEAARRDLDGDEAEALATRHAEERRARREREAEAAKPEG